MTTSAPAEVAPSRARVAFEPDAAWLGRVALAVLLRPRLWRSALTQLARLAAPGWWRRSPFLPLPDAGYLHFRLETMYGGAAPPEPTATDLVTYLGWCRDFPHA